MMCSGSYRYNKSRNPEKVSKIVAALDLKIHPRDLKSKDTRHLQSAIFSQWLPLSTCIIQTIIDVVPAPPVAQATRIRAILDNEAALKPNSKVEEDLLTANSQPSASVLAYVSKMFAVPSAALSKKLPRAEEARRGPRDTRAMERVKPETMDDKVVPSSPAPGLSERKDTAAGEQDEVLLGFARLYSGVIRTGSTLYCVLPKYNIALGPSHPNNVQHLVTAPVEGLYVMMGRELVPVDFVRAGNIFAIKGLEGRVWRNATLCGPTEAGVESEPWSAEAKDYILNLAGISHTVCVMLLRAFLNRRLSSSHSL
jgi:ribosome assembly protein 1